MKDKIIKLISAFILAVIALALLIGFQWVVSISTAFLRGFLSNKAIIALCVLAITIFFYYMPIESEVE